VTEAKQLFMPEALNFGSPANETAGFAGFSLAIAEVAVRLGIGVKPKSETPTLQLSFSASFPLTRLLRAFYSVEKR